MPRVVRHAGFNVTHVRSKGSVSASCYFTPVLQCRHLFEQIVREQQSALPATCKAGSEDARTASETQGSQPEETSHCDDATSSANVDWAVVIMLARQQTGLQHPTEVAKLLHSVEPSSDKPSAVQLNDFLCATKQIYSGLSKHQLAHTLAPKLAGKHALRPISHLPPELQQHVRAQPMYAQAPWITPAAVLELQQAESVSEVLGVDCRSEEEYAVSTILQALLLELLPTRTNDLGFEPDPDALQDVGEAIQEAVDVPTVGRPVVVTFCTDGSRSAMVRLMQVLHAVSCLLATKVQANPQARTLVDAADFFALHAICLPCILCTSCNHAASENVHGLCRWRSSCWSNSSQCKCTVSAVD